MKRVTIGAGVEFNQNSRPISPTSLDCFRQAIVNMTALVYGGCTIIETYGAWKDASGQIVREKGWSIIVLLSPEHEKDAQFHADNIGLFVRDTLDQSAVYVTLEDVNGKLLGR